VGNTARQHTDALQLLGLLEGLLVFPLSGLGHSLLRQVPDHHHRSGNDAVGPDRSYRTADRNELAIFVEEGILDAWECFPGSEHLQVGTVVAGVRGSVFAIAVQPVVKRLAHELVLGPAQHGLGRPIDERDPALVVDQQDAVGRVADDRVGQVLLILELLLRALPLGVVPDDLGQAGQDPGIVPEAEHDPIGPKARPVFAHVPAGVLRPP
jgi:hypothetical protein